MCGRVRTSILIVDDDAAITTRLSEMLREKGYEVVGVATSGTEGVDMAKSLKPDIILMDIVMPGDHGLDAMKAIRVNDPEAKIIVVTALNGPRMLEMAKENGAVDHLVKPYNFERLVESIERQLD